MNRDQELEMLLPPAREALATLNELMAGPVAAAEEHHMAAPTVKIEEMDKHTPRSQRRRLRWGDGIVEKDTPAPSESCLSPRASAKRREAGDAETKHEGDEEKLSPPLAVEDQNRNEGLVRCASLWSLLCVFATILVAYSSHLKQ